MNKDTENEYAFKIRSMDHHTIQLPKSKRWNRTEMFTLNSDDEHFLLLFLSLEIEYGIEFIIGAQYFRMYIMTKK